MAGHVLVYIKYINIYIYIYVYIYIICMCGYICSHNFTPCRQHNAKKCSAPYIYIYIFNVLVYVSKY